MGEGAGVDDILGEGAFWDGEAEGVEIHGEVKIKIKD